MAPAFPAPAFRAVWLARAALLWERSALVWAPPALAVLAVWAAAAWGLLEPLPVALHAAIVAAVLAAGGWAAWRGARRFRWPTRDEARRRAETDSGLKHAPLAGLDDQPATGDPTLWAAHRARIEAEAARARGRRPRAGLAAADPLALRFALPLALALGWWLGGDAGPQRLSTAFRPDLKADARPLTLEAWATPPAYTGAPPQPLPAGGGAVRLPAGSTVAITVRGASGPPVLTGLARRRMDVSGDRVHAAEFAVARSGRLTVRRGGVQATWLVRTVPDKFPSIAFAAPPARGEGDALALLYRARDDHGVAAVRLELRRGLRTVVEAVDLPASPDAPQAAALDLTRTPFAGRTVSATLIAADAAGQESRSRPVRVLVPERVYTDPAALTVAAAAVRLRREWRFYALWKRSPPEPAGRSEERLMATLGPYYALHDAPPAVRAAADTTRRLLDGAGPPLRDPIAAAGLTWTLRRLAGAQSLRDAKALAPELVAVAERLERGSAGSAEEALRQAQRRLREAVARGAPPDEVARLLDEVKAAMTAYLAALQRTAPPDSPGDAPAIEVTSADLEALWRAVEDALARGDTEKAMALMDAIAQLLAALQSGDGSGQGEGGAGGRALASLQDEQRALGDETFGATYGEGLGDLDAMARRQARLAAQARQASGSASGDAQDRLQEAATAMDEAATALREYVLDDAVRAQRRAQTALAEGARALEAGRNAAGLLDQALGEADPLGRRGGAGGGEGSASTEADSPALNARRALQAIRARAADRSRSETELRYLERLLERF